MVHTVSSANRLIITDKSLNQIRNFFSSQYKVMSTIPLLLVLAFFDEVVFSASVDFLLAVDDILPKKMIYQNLGSQYMYRISLAIRQGWFKQYFIQVNR